MIEESKVDAKYLPEVVYISDETKLGLHEQAENLVMLGYRRMKRLRIDRKYGMKLRRGYDK